MGNIIKIFLIMKIAALCALFATSSAIRMKSNMPTGSETLCAMRRAGRLDLENTFFDTKNFKEHRDGGFNTQALVQTGDEGEGKSKGKLLDQTSFERHLQQNMGNNAGLVYNANF